MKKRRQRFLSIGIVISAFLVLVSGCISTGKNARSISELPAESEEMPKELKISAFILGMGDTIEITVYRHADLEKTIQIDSSGMITFPLIGDMKASGLGVLEFRDKIRDGLSKYIINPQVSVVLTSIQSKKYSVLGEVNNPGVFSLDSSVNIIEATAKAQGFTNDAKLKTILLIRRGASAPELYAVNLEKVIEGGDFTQNIDLQNGDIIYVPATRIADMSRYFSHLSKIIAPFISMESAYFTGQQIEGGRGSASISR